MAQGDTVAAAEAVVMALGPCGHRKAVDCLTEHSDPVRAAWYFVRKCRLYEME